MKRKGWLLLDTFVLNILYWAAAVWNRTLRLRHSYSSQNMSGLMNRTVVYLFLLHVLLGFLVAAAEHVTRKRHGSSDMLSHFGSFMLIWAPLHILSAIVFVCLVQYSDPDRLAAFFIRPFAAFLGLLVTAGAFFLTQGIGHLAKRLRFHWNNMKD